MKTYTVFILIVTLSPQVSLSQQLDVDRNWEIPNVDNGLDDVVVTMRSLIDKRDRFVATGRSLKAGSDQQEYFKAFPPIEDELNRLAAIESEYRGSAS
ncbi:MAG TPA: hypothetical protein DDW52_10145, partial [Planctomycetaceae bacterium]|nr:hypothetical protein [Planctomycetaceae bacterium]